MTDIKKKLLSIMQECMADAQESHGKIAQHSAEYWRDKVLKVFADRNRGTAIYVDPEVENMLADDDALSQDLSISKYGGTINGKRAIPYVRAHKG